MSNEMMGTDFDAMFGDVSMTETPTPVVEEKVVEPVVETVVESVTVNQEPQPSPDVVPTSVSVQAPQMVQQPVQAPVVQQTTAVQKNTGVSDDFEIGFSKEMEQSLADIGIEVGEIGVKVSKVPIERYKASASKVDRISFLTKRVIPIKYHFIEGVGSVMCFHGKCCEIGGVPQVRYLFPIAVYQTDAEGNISGNKVELKILSAGEDLYKSITTINKGTAQYGGIDHGDMLVTCTDEKYQKISLTFAGPAVWRKYSQIAEFLQKRWMQDGANAYMAVARKVDEPTFNKLMNLDDSEDMGPQSTFDAAANQDLSAFFNDND